MSRASEYRRKKNLGIAVAIGVLVVAGIGYVGHGVYASVVQDVESQVAAESVENVPATPTTPLQQVIEQARDGLTDGAEEETDPSQAQ